MPEVAKLGPGQTADDAAPPEDLMTEERVGELESLLKADGIISDEPDAGLPPPAEEPEGGDAEEPAGDPETGEDEGDGGEEAAETKTKPTAESRDLEKAATALKRSGWTDEDLEGMSEPRILALGKREREAEADRERMRQKIQELEVQKDDSSGEEDQPAQAEGSPSFDPEKAIRALADEIGDEAADSLKPMFEAFGSMRAELDALRGSQAQASFEAERSRLAGVYPELADDALFNERVKPEIENLSASPQYKGKGLNVLPEMLEKAVRIAGLERKEDEAESGKQDSPTVGRRNAGSARGAGKREGRFTQRSTEQLEAQSLSLLMSEGENGANYKAVSKALQQRQEAEFRKNAG